MTLLEIVAGLTLMTISMAGALSIYSSSRDSQINTGMSNDLYSIRQAIRLVKQSQGAYGTASLNSTLITANRLPPSMSASGATINTVYGGTLTITGAATTFNMVLTAVPKSACMHLATSTDASWVSVKVDASSAVTALPLSPTAANDVTRCGSAATTHTLTLSTT